MKRRPYLVTIDGPSASGKTSVSRQVARILQWDWLSTGVFYRGLALMALKNNASLDDENLLEELCTDPRWSVVMASDHTRLTMEGQDVTAEINSEEVSSAASRVSQFPKVRQALLKAQRDCAFGKTGLIAEGRDCGTVIFPEAALKFYLTAESGSRAHRRAAELGVDVGETEKHQQVRDERDSNRSVAPLQAAPDAILVDTSHLQLNQVVSLIESKIRHHYKLKV